MSRLAEIYKSEKQKGGGLGSALAKRSREKYDPRQMFNQQGLLASMFPSIFKAYKATGSTSDKSKFGNKTPQVSSEIVSTAIESKFDVLIGVTHDVNNNSKMAAKNSMVLPMLARDMNVMRQNVIKLVKLQGGTASTKADAFFLKAKERESSYESQFNKGNKTSKPSPVSGGGEKEGGGLLKSIFKLLGPFLLLNLGAKIVGALGSAVLGLGELVLKGLSSIFSINNLMSALGIGSNVLSGIVRIIGMVATNPLFLGLAAITTASAALAYMRGQYDEGKNRYLELAKKKQEGGLSDSEEKELQKLNNPAVRSEATKQLGYDPIRGTESEAKTPGQIAAEQRRQSIRQGAPDAAGGGRGKQGGPTASELQAHTVGGGRGGQGGATAEELAKALKPSVVPSTPAGNVNKALLDVIASGESGALGYEAYNTGKAGKGGRYPGLTEMSVGDVLRLQSSGHIFAAGRYQIIPSTLLGLLNKKVVKDTDRFDENTQDKLGQALIDQRISGISDPIQQQYALSKEWAAIPVPAGLAIKSGSISTGKESYYQGIAGNAANIQTASVQSALSGQPGGVLPTTLAASTNTMGSTLASASADTSTNGQLMGLLASLTGQSPIINNVTNNNVSNGGGSQGSPNIPSAYDDLFADMLRQAM